MYMRLKLLLPTVIGFFLIFVSTILGRSMVTTPISWDPSEGRRWNDYLDGSTITTASVHVGSRYIVHPPSDVRASVECSVVSTGNGLYRYTYKVTNIGSHPVAAVALDALGEIANLSRLSGQLIHGKYVWNYAKSEGVKRQFYSIVWNGKQGGYTATEYGLSPAQLVEFVLESPSPPGGVQLSVRGVGWVIDGVDNQIVTPPVDFWVTGPVFGPVQALAGMNREELLAYITSQSVVAVDQGWVTGNASVALSAMMSQIEEASATTRNGVVVIGALNELSLGLNELGSGAFSKDLANTDFVRYLSVSLRYYYDRFCKVGAAK